MVHLPYVNVLLGKLEQEGDAELKALARHLHFGFWGAPQEAADTQEDLAVAGDRLSDLVCTAAAVGDDQTILDVGCGLGGTIARINRHRCGVALHGLNIDSRQLLRAAATVAADGNAIGFVGGDACALPFADRVFDAVIAIECSFHFSSRARFLAEVARVLKPGGRFATTDVVRGHRDGLAGAAVLALLPRVLDSAFYGRIDISYSADDYRRAAVAAGLSPFVERDISSEVDPSYPVIRRILRKWRCRRASAEAELGRRLSRHGIIRYVLLSFAKR
jgi:SAM-dependent methyltransferase